MALWMSWVCWMGVCAAAAGVCAQEITGTTSYYENRVDAESTSTTSTTSTTLP